MLKKNKLVHTEEIKIGEKPFRLEVLEYSEDSKIISFYCRVYEQTAKKEWIEICYCEPLGPIVRQKPTTIAQTSYKKSPDPNPAGMLAADVAELGWAEFRKTL